jgi:hypothetical protein
MCEVKIEAFTRFRHQDDFSVERPDATSIKVTKKPAEVFSLGGLLVTQSNAAPQTADRAFLLINRLKVLMVYTLLTPPAGS